ncbi:hypothetical protein K1W54_17690, partial [Micromonospora sp. CPCC 205371]|nr:hypothetical protein [Micromonospora sp. CPCC 205371]
MGRPAALALAAVIGGSLAVRRRWPLAGYAVGAAALAVDALWLGPSGLSPLANMVGLYSLGAHSNPWRALWGAPLMLAGIVAYFVGGGGRAAGPRPRRPAGA